MSNVPDALYILIIPQCHRNRRPRTYSLSPSYMPSPIPSHRDSAHYRDYICRIFNLPLADVVDLTGYINCGGFIAAGGSGQIYKGEWVEPNNPSSHGRHTLPKVAVKLISVPALISEKRKEKRFKVRTPTIWTFCNVNRLSVHKT